MTIVTEGTITNWKRQEDIIVFGACTIEAKVDGGTWQTIGSIPLPSGENQASVNLRGCLVRFTGVTGECNFKPDNPTE